MNEKMKILIAYDGSDCANAALDDLQRAGLPQDTEALIITVAEVFLPPPPPSSYEIVEAVQEEHYAFNFDEVYARNKRVVEEARSLALRAAERLQKNFPGWQVSVEADADSPAWGVLKKAGEWKPDLIVVGSHGRSALGRLVMGSVSQKVLTEARCSVRIARGRTEVEDSSARIIVGIDGSSGSEAAVRAVAARRWPQNSEVRAIIVEDPLVPPLLGNLVPPVAKWAKESNKSEDTWAQNLAAGALHDLQANGLKVTSSVMTGDPKRALIEEAKRWGADSIFVGSTGFSNRFERFLLGSVSAAVAARAHCSVEVVRETKAIDEDTPGQ
jgi:nucleotide-binding universal stress UspA family protein